MPLNSEDPLSVATSSTARSSVASFGQRSRSRIIVLMVRAEEATSLFSGWARKIHFFGLYFWLKYGISLVWSTSTGCPATIPATNG